MSQVGARHSASGRNSHSQSFRAGVHLQETETKDGENHQLLLPLQAQLPDGGHGSGEDHEVGDDVHDGRQVPHRQGVDALVCLAGNENGDGYARHAYENLLGDAPSSEEDEKDEGDDASPALEDAAVLEEEGDFGDDLREVIDDHAGEESLFSRVSLLQQRYVR